MDRNPSKHKVSEIIRCPGCRKRISDYTTLAVHVRFCPDVKFEPKDGVVTQ